MTLALSTEGIPWGLRKRWHEKYINAWRRHFHGPGTPRRRKHWGNRSKAILKKYPFAARPLRYNVYFERMETQYNGGQLKEDIMELHKQVVESLGVPLQLLNREEERKTDAL